MPFDQYSEVNPVRRHLAVVVGRIARFGVVPVIPAHLQKAHPQFILTQVAGGGPVVSAIETLPTISIHLSNPPGLIILIIADGVWTSLAAAGFLPTVQIALFALHF